MDSKPSKTTSQIILLCIGFMGLQVGFALQAGNVTRVLQNFGADLTQVSLFWIIAPLSGAIVQPLIGYWSDISIANGKTRISYLIFGAVLCAIALFTLPNANLLTGILSPLLLGAILLALIDISFNITMHPLRATITDYLPKEQQPNGFAIQTCLISIGAILGSILPYILHNIFGLLSVSHNNNIPENVKWSFYIGAFTLLLCIMVTAKTISRYGSKRNKSITLASHTSFKITTISSKIWQLGLIQFFSWAGFFLLWVFMTPALSQHIYKEFDFSAKSELYSYAANYSGILFGIYHIAAGLFALILPITYKRLNIISVHTLALLLGGVGLLSIYISNNVSQLYIPMVLIGIAWASILATPFVLLSKIIPKQKVGLYFGLFNLFITVPQLVVGISSGSIIDYYFQGEAINAMVIAGFCLIAASIVSYLCKKSFY